MARMSLASYKYRASYCHLTRPPISGVVKGRSGLPADQYAGQLLRRSDLCYPVTIT
jgi:hypothetical protein